ncbi:uncharacterized protein [Elaeis guineensis]|uniref:uncharacterized protein n=1 Tax=Elaeis guineensis var. tenera TaxID=51953 RepID=UPI003C6D42FC
MFPGQILAQIIDSCSARHALPRTLNPRSHHRHSTVTSSLSPPKMAWRGSISRSLLATARSSSSSLRSPAAAPRLRPPPLATPRLQRRRPSFSLPGETPVLNRTLGELGCTQSLLPLHSVVALPRLTSHLSVSARACCELSQGTFRRTCQDR